MCFQVVSAENVSRDEAVKKAYRFFTTHRSISNKDRSNVPLPEFQQVVLKGMKTDDECFYIYKCVNTPAFVIVSGESSTREILAYSFEDTFDENNLAPGTICLLDNYKKQIKLIKDKKATAKPTFTRFIASGGKVIETAKWNQSYDFWWNQCPSYNGERCHAGCVAAAMSIAMRYYSWPESGYGSNSYYTRTYNIYQSANFNTTYNWNLPMGNEYDTGWTVSAQNDVAKILHHAGVAVNMNYSPNGSGASIYKAFYALLCNFKYNKYMNYIDRSDYNDEEWTALLMKEIDEDRVIICNGKNDANEGHAYICDGYDNTGMFRFNFGWSGSCNGFYSIDDICGYSIEQSAIIGIQPESTPPEEHKYDLMFVNSEGEDFGLKIQKINCNDDVVDIDFRAYYVKNLSNVTFSGNVALYICNSSGTVKQELCRKAIEIDPGFVYWYQRSCWDPETHTAWIEYEPFISLSACIHLSDNFKKSDRIWLKFSTDDTNWHTLYGISEDACSLPLPIELVSDAGDVDGDGNVTISDVTVFIDILLNGSVASGNADVDGDGRVNIDDLTALIDRLLSGN